MRGERGDWMLTDLRGHQYFIPDIDFKALYDPDPTDPEATRMYEQDVAQ